jgi:hypothetical protein
MPQERSAHPIRSLLKRSPLYAGFKQLGHYPDYWYWKLRGEPRRIPHLIKQRTINQYAREFGLTTLVETGTYYGEMVAAMIDRFRRIYSIELDPELAAQANQRFRNRSHVEIIRGDSQIVVPWLLQQLNERCLWWLDAGYCGWSGTTGSSTRLGSEFSAILSDGIQDHVILMDDADGIKDEHGSPILSQVVASIESSYPNRQVTVAHNIMRITPRRTHG